MGQKINPISFRLGITKDWRSHWLLTRKNKHLLEEDYLVKQEIKKQLVNAGLEKIEIRRLGSKLKISLKVARPGFVIGRGGKGLENLRKTVEKKVFKFRRQKNIKDGQRPELSIEELKKTEISAQVTAQNIAFSLEKRMPFRRVMKKTLDNIFINKGVKGAKIKICGRLDGTEHARCEWLGKGRLPRQTLRADIDYGEVTAFTTYGAIGVKVWIYKGEIFEQKA